MVAIIRWLVVDEAITMNMTGCVFSVLSCESQDHVVTALISDQRLTAVFGMFDVAMLGLKLLALVGGFSIGAVFSGLVLRLMSRLVMVRTVPRLVTRLVQGVGGGTLGMAVWIWAFGSGGSGLGGSGDLRSSGVELPSSGLERQGSKVESATATSEPSPAATNLRVELLGGPRVHNERFYLVDGDSRPCSLAEVRERIRTLMNSQDRKPLKAVELVIYEDSVAQDHPAVEDLAKWARRQDLSVTLAFPKRLAPP
jgi:hypothetical protein